MRKMPIGAAVVRWGVAMSMAVAMAPAQKTDIQNVIRFQVKPDRVGEFESAMKEMQAVMQKAKYERGSTMWQSGAGPMEYLLVYYNNSYADVFSNTPSPSLKEVQPSLTALRLRVLACTNAMERRVSEVVSDVSMPRGTPPPYVRTIRSEVKAGKMEPYMAMLKELVLPAMKKAGMQTFLVFRQRYGGSSNEVVSATGVTNLADLDQSPSPVVKAMGEAGYKQYLAKRAELVEHSETNIFRFRKDLSYQPATSGQVTGGQ